jgi:hypothetical protein
MLLLARPEFFGGFSTDKNSVANTAVGAGWRYTHLPVSLVCILYTTGNALNLNYTDKQWKNKQEKWKLSIQQNC